MGALDSFIKGSVQQWEEQRDETIKGSFENPPDGEYIVKLVGAEGKESQKGRPMIQWDFTILEGELVGKKKTEFMLLDGKLGFQPLQWRLQSFGVDLKTFDISQLEQTLAELVNNMPPMRIRLQTPADSEFQNMRILRMLPNYEGVNAGPQVVELEVGMRVNVTTASGKEVGTISALHEEESKVSVKVGKETLKISADSVTAIV